MDSEMREQIVQRAEAALGAWEQFVAEWKALGEVIRRADPHLWRRVDAYPGWDGLRDVGAGQSFPEWIAECGYVGTLGEEEEEEYDGPYAGDHDTI